MADVNNLLPDVGKIDTSISINDDMSLEKIANQYNSLGHNVRDLGVAAAEDVHNRQVKLIGNDFGGVDPVSWNAYYQPAISDTQSEMRVKGTEKALDVGMERGKAAAEANLNAAKNAYSSALDGYNNAKQAFANAKVAVIDSGMLPDGVSDQDFLTFADMQDNPEKYRNAWMQNFTDVKNIDYNIKDIRKVATEYTKSHVKNDKQGQDYWDDPEVSRVWTKAYYDEYAKRKFGEKTYQQWKTQYDYALKYIDGILDVVSNISETLPENKGIKWEDEFALVPKTMDPNKLALKGNGDRNTDDVWDDDEGTYETYTQIMLKDYIDDAYNSLFGGGFTISDLQWLDEWRDQNPQQFNAYKNQVAMMNGTSSHIEVANGEEYYFINGTYEKPKKGTPIFFTYKGAVNEDGSYNNDKLKTFMELWKDYYQADVNGASDGEMADKEKAMNDAYKEYMKTISARAMLIARSNMPDTGALSAAAIACVDGVSNSKQKINGKTVADWVGEYKKITGESKDAATKILYDLANRANANNGYVLVADTQNGGVTAANLKYGEDKNSALSGKNKLEWKGGNFAQDGWASNLNNEEAYALFTVLTQSMTDYNNGTDTNKNIDPGFLKQDAHNVLWHSVIDAGAGAVKGAEAIGAFLGSSVGALFGSGENPWEADFMGIKGHSMKNTFGVMFDGIGIEDFLLNRGKAVDHKKAAAEATKRGVQYNNPDSVLDGIQTKFAQEDAARKIAQQFINPMMTEVFLAETDEDKKKAMANIKGIASGYSTETNAGMWWRDTLLGFAGTAAEMYLEGKAIGLTIGLFSKGTRAATAATARGAKKLASKIIPEAVAKGTQKYADIIASLNDPYQVDRAATQILNKSDDVANVVSDSARAAEKARTAKTFENALDVAGDTTEALTTKAVTAGRGLSGKLESIKSMIVTNGIDDMYGVLSRSAAHAMSSLGSIDNADDLLEVYNKFLTTARSSVEALNDVYKTSGGFRLPSGATVTVVDAMNATYANRVVSTATVAMSSGRTIDSVAKLGDAERGFLMKALNLMTNPKKGAFTSNIIGGINAKSNMNAFMKTMGPQNFKILVDKTLEIAEKNANFGKAFDVTDAYRALAEAGWKNGSLYFAGRDFVKEAIKNPIIDLYRGAVNPTLDENGNFKVETTFEYFNNPMNLVTNTAFDVGTYTFKKVWNSVGSTHSRHMADKAFNALAATGERSGEEAAALFKKAVNWQNKAQMYADKAWHQGASYDVIQKNVELSNKAIDNSVREIFKANKWSTDYGGKHYDFKNKEDFYKFIDETKMNPQQGLTVIADSMLLKSANNYFMFKNAMGTGVGEWGDTPANARRRILRTMDNSGKKARESIVLKKTASTEEKIKALHASYQMIKADVLAANAAGEYGLTIRNLDKALDSFFNTLEGRAAEGLRTGDLPGIELGYIPISSLTYDGDYADMIDSHKNAATRGLLLKGGENINVTAANPGELREKLSLTMILDAWDRGDNKIELHDNNGKVTRTMLLDKNGLDPVDMLTVYANNYNIHKYVDPIFGDNRMKFGEQALRNANAYIRGDFNAMSAIAKKDLALLHARMYGKTGKNGNRYKGLTDIAFERAFEAGDITEAEYKNLVANAGRPINEVLSSEAKTRATKIKQAVDKNTKGIETQKKIVDNGGNPDFMFQTMARALNLTNDGGDLDLTTSREIVKLGVDNVDPLIEAYSTGLLSEDNFKDGYRVEVDLGTDKKTGEKITGWRTIAVDETLLNALRNAYSSGKTLDTVFTVATYVDTAPVYCNIKTKNGKTITRQAYGYESKILNAFRKPKESTRFDLSQNKAFNDFKFAEGTTLIHTDSKGKQVYNIDVSGKTVKQAIKDVEKVVGASKAPQKASQSVTEGVSKKPKYAVVDNNYKPIFEELKNQNPELVTDLKAKGEGKLIADGKYDFNSIPKKWLMSELGQGNSLYGGNVKLLKDLGIKEPSFTIAGKHYDLVKIFQNRYNLGRTESGDLMVKTSESGFDKLQTLTEQMLYKRLGAKGDAQKGWTPDTVTERIVSGVMSRIKVELGDSEGGFAASEWFERLDQYLPDADIIQKFTLADIPQTKSSNQSIATFINNLERDGSVELFATRLNDVATNILAGDYDDIIPNGVSRQQFANSFAKAAELLTWSEEYANKPKAMQELSEKKPSDDEDADVDYMDRYNNEVNPVEYGVEYDENGNPVDVMPESQFVAKYSNIDLDKDGIMNRLEALRTVAKMYNTPESKFHKIIHSEELDAIHKGRIDASNDARTHYDNLVASGKKLYKSGKSAEYNKAVDAAKFDIEARVRAGRGADAEATAKQLDAAYAEALGLVSEDTRINSIGINKMTTEQYNAAMLAKSSGIVDNEVGGYSERLNNLRIQAGTYGGYYEQIMAAYKQYATFAGMLDKNGNIKNAELLKGYNKAEEQYKAMDSILKTRRSDSVDNTENALTALFGDVNDPKNARSKVDTFDLERQVKFLSNDFNKVINNTLFGNEEGRALYDANSEPTGRAAAHGDETNLYYKAMGLMDEVNAAVESNNSAVAGEKYREFLAVADVLFDRYTEGWNDYVNKTTPGSKVDFETQLINSFDEVKEIANEVDAIKEKLDNYKDEYLTPSELTGKKSLIPKEYIQFAASTFGGGKNLNDLPEIKVGNETYTIDSTYGTSSLDTDSGFGKIAYDKEGNKVNLHELYESLKTDAEKQQLIDSLNKTFEEAGDGYRFVKNSDLVRTKDAGYDEMIENYAKTHDGKQLTPEEAKKLSKETSEDIKRKTLSGYGDLESRLKELNETRKIILEEVREYRAEGDLSENEDYTAAMNNLKAIDSEISNVERELKGYESAELEANPHYGEDILQRVGDYVLVEYYDAVDANNNPIPGSPFDGSTERAYAREQLSDQDIRDMVIAEYSVATSKRNPTEEVNVAKAKIEKFEKANEKLEDASDNLSKKLNQEVIDREALIKKHLTQSEYNELLRMRKEYRHIKENMPTKDSDFYHSNQGYAIAAKGEAIPKGHTTLGVIFNLYGYDPKKFIKDVDNHKFTPDQIKADYKERRKMMKEVNANLRSGNAVYKNVKDFQMPDTLDIKSTAMTLNNLIEFYKQVKQKTGIKNLSFDDVIVSKDYMDFLSRVSRQGIGLTASGKAREKVGKIAMEISDWNKFIQETQLAGGASWVNALSIAQLRGAMFSDPKAMGQYLSLVQDFRDDAAVAKFAVENNERLVKIGMTVGDTTVFTDLAAAASNRPGYRDGGQFSSAIDSIMTSIEEGKEAFAAGAGKYGYYKNMIMDGMDAFFSDATFKRVIPVLRAKMMIRNYDLASRLILKHYPDISKQSLDTAASQFAYAKTTAFFEPRKTQSGLFKSRSINEILDNVATERQRQVLTSWIGAKDEPSILQMGGNVFFALGYKNRMIQSILQGARSILSPTENIQRVTNKFGKSSLSNADIHDNTLLRNLGTQFTQLGNRNQVRTLVFIAAAAFINAKALGLATPWDDLNFEDEENVDENGNPKFKVPEILTKFQTIGQIWIPNAIDQEGHLYIDPTKTAFNIDTMSSMFTLPNTAWKTIDRTFAPQGYYSAPQRGVGLIGQEFGINAQGLNDVLNSAPLRAIGDELIGSNLLSPYKALYEVLVDSSYYGNNIWEKKYLKDGSINKNYDPVRNIKASVFHILGLDALLSPRGYNDYVKGYYTNKYVSQDQMGSITGAGILQHEYATAFFNIIEGKYIEGVAEGGELPIKKANFSSKARTDFNTNAKNAITQYLKEYRAVVDNTTSLDAKDEAYAKLVQKTANTVAAWSAKYGYVLGKDQKLVPYVTKQMIALLAGEYDDNLDYVQNTFWKASAIAQIEATGPDGYWLDDKDIDLWIAKGKTAEEFAEEKNKRHEAYNQALNDEYEARKALHDAGIDNEYLAGMNLKNLRAQQRLVNKEVYEGALGKLNSKVGEFANFKEMKKYYEAQIDAATNTTTKANLAKQYNKYVTDVLAPYVDKYGASIITDGYYNNDYLSNALAEYVIIPADKYYRGKTPRANYLKDLFHVGYNDKSALPSDKEVIAAYTKASKAMHEGYAASATSMLDTLLDAIKKGRMYASDADYSKIVRMKALLNAKSK